MNWQEFTPAKAPPSGRYLVQRPDGYWHEAYWEATDWCWKYTDMSGRIIDVLYYMEIIPHG